MKEEDSDDCQGDCCFSQSRDPSLGACYLLCGGAHTATVILVCVVGITEQSIIDGSSAFDLSGQTQSQCELTVRNKRLLRLIDSGVHMCVCV